MRFSYYRRLSRRHQAVYRKSDTIGEIVLPNPAKLKPEVDAIKDALAVEDRRAVQRATAGLVRDLLRSLEAPPVRVKVLARRPTYAASELHGLYSYEEGEKPEISLWMRTAAHGRVVAFRTFVRTMLHELCHHLDFAHFRLAESFHTEGFFRRESSLMHQIAPPARTKKRPAKKKPSGKKTAQGRPATKLAARHRSSKAEAASQLELPMSLE